MPIAVNESLSRAVNECLLKPLSGKAFVYVVKMVPSVIPADSRNPVHS